VLCFDSLARYLLIFDIVITHNGDEPIKDVRQILAYPALQYVSVRHTFISLQFHGDTNPNENIL